MATIEMTYELEDALNQLERSALAAGVDAGEFAAAYFGERCQFPGCRLRAHDGGAHEGLSIQTPFYGLTGYAKNDGTGWGVELDADSVLDDGQLEELAVAVTRARTWCQEQNNKLSDYRPV